MSRIIVSKIDVAKRQLETAISLWFQNGDLVSIETLVAASYDVLFDLAKANKLQMPPYDQITTDKEKQRFTSLRHKSASFFKHADHDFNNVHEFEDRTVEYYILYTIEGYKLIANVTTAILELFLWRFCLLQPNAPQRALDIGKGFPFADAQLSREEFVEKFLPDLIAKYAS